MDSMVSAKRRGYSKNVIGIVKKPQAARKNIVRIQATPIPNNDHAKIFLYLPGAPIANKRDDAVSATVENGPNITNNRTLIKP